MSYDIVSGVMREAGRVMAERLLPNTRQHDRRDYSYDDYDRRRSRSPRPYSCSGSSLGCPGSDSGTSYGRRDSSPYGDPRDRYHHRRGDDRPHRRDDSSTYWSDSRYRSPSPGRGAHQRRDSRHQDNRRGQRRGHRGRGRGRGVQRESSNEEALRRRVVDSRPAVPRTLFPPNIMAATRDNDGHPLFPEAELEDGESTEELDAIREPRDYLANENRRREVATADEGSGKVYRKIVDRLDPLRVGPWCIATGVVTFVQAINILRWVHAGDTFTAEFLKSVQTRLGTDPTIHRSQGEVTLLQHQMDAMRRYNAIIEGRKLARTRTSNAEPAGAPFQAPPAGPATIGGPAPTTTTTSITAPTAAEAPAAGPDDDEPMPEHDPSEPDDDAVEDQDPVETPGYLGTSVHGDTDTTIVVLTEHATADAFARFGMRSPLLKAKRWYANIPTAHWPRGMRVSQYALPSTTSAVPHDADVRAWFTINALSPDRGPDGTSVHRARFLDALIRLLSIHGTFHRYTQFGQYVVARLPFEHYPFESVNISFAQIVAWFVQHGIDSQSESVAVLESFARARRNHAAGVEDVNTLEFSAGFPASMNEVANIVVREEDLWINLRHGAVRADATTMYPSHPAGDVEMRPLPEQTPEELATLQLAA
ncbi:hypothetical protein B0H15DRAFT_950281 [Mycena belliarum]|uniref:Uncharacterized protein n=1 Tax=Mycena belliarum TaxID=1033014 RepID=A0AAD6U1F1_9AGAR|nr:hypothetical protein B0H15DRAFT_950281 [Mycena belliae]